jgi:hypothetical protein
LTRQKYPKALVIGNAFLPHRPLPCKTGRITGCNILPHFVRTIPSLQQKITMPFPRLKANLFCLFSSKAVPLTGLPTKYPFTNLFFYKSIGHVKTGRAGCMA